MMQNKTVNFSILKLWKIIISVLYETEKNSIRGNKKQETVHCLIQSDRIPFGHSISDITNYPHSQVQRIVRRNWNSYLGIDFKIHQNRKWTAGVAANQPKLLGKYKIHKKKSISIASSVVQRDTPNSCFAFYVTRFSSWFRGEKKNRKNCSVSIP